MVSLKRLLLVAAAVLAVAVSALLIARAWGSGAPARVATIAIAPARPATGAAPRPPQHALVLARQAGDLAVAVALRHARLGARAWVTVLRSDGAGLDRARVAIRLGSAPARRAAPCGHGCYAVRFGGPSGARRLDVVVTPEGGRAHAASFALPLRWPLPAASVVAGAARALRSAHSVVYRERLSSGLGAVVRTTFRELAPGSLTYAIRGGSAAVIVGSRRWDRTSAGGRWAASAQQPLELPARPWGAHPYDASLLARGPRTVTVSFYDPVTPAWYEVVLDRRTRRPRRVAMTAAAHFMRDVYVAYDLPLRIRPPRAAYTP